MYALGWPELTRHGRWSAALLSCGPGAALSHGSAGEALGIGREQQGLIEVSVPARSRPRGAGIVVHRRKALGADDVTVREGLLVTTPICTLIDLAARLPPEQLERAVNEADRLDLTNPEALRRALDEPARRLGSPALRRMLDRRTFVLTDSELERRFLPIARDVGLPRPRTQELVNGFRVDFYWPELGLVVETDGLRYHRTAAQQSRDRLRDQTHVAAGLTCLRFTHAQVATEPERVKATLRAVARRLARSGPR